MSGTSDGYSLIHSSQTGNRWMGTCGREISLCCDIFSLLSVVIVAIWTTLPFDFNVADEVLKVETKYIQHYIL